MKKSVLDTGRVPEWNLLATWVAVAQSGSVSAASRMLNISQAAVSQRLKALESVTGAVLLDRSTRPAKPTPAGQRLYDHASRMLAQAGELIEAMSEFSLTQRNVLRFGAVDSFAGTLGPALVRGLTTDSLQVRLTSGLTPALEEQLESRSIDFAVTTSAAVGRGNIRKHTLFYEPYLLALPKGLDVGTTTTLTELAHRLPLIRYSARSVIGHDLDVYLEVGGAQIERTFAFDNTDPMLSLVAAGMGFALTTSLCIWQSRHFLPDLQLLELSILVDNRGDHCVSPTRNFFLAYREDESSELLARTRSVVDQAVEKLMDVDIAAALKLPSRAIWSGRLK